MYKKRSIIELYRLAKGERVDCCVPETPQKSCCSVNEITTCCDNKDEKDC